MPFNLVPHFKWNICSNKSKSAGKGLKIYHLKQQCSCVDVADLLVLFKNVIIDSKI